MRVAIYLRVSTKEQTTDNQRRELEAAVAGKGWQVVAVFEDAGISGSKGRDKRPAFDELHKAITQGKVDMVAAWSVDRLGRSLQDLVGFLAELRGSKVELYLHQQAIDTSTNAGRMLFGMLSVFADFERGMIVERVNAGLARAKAQGKRLGPPSIPVVKREAIAAARGTGLSSRAVAKQHGVSEGTVRNVWRAA